MRRRNRGGRSQTADRYKKAATDALALLDWCIGYFTHHQQGKLASQLERNRDHIRARLDGGSGG
jgi:hypothetical protein